MRPIYNYPYSVGPHQESVFPHVGPVSYAVVTYGPVAGGDLVNTTEAGLKFFDHVSGGQTDSGNFSVQAIPTQPSNVPQAGAPSYRLRWVSNRTASIGGQAQTAGAEAVATTNLSGETLRLRAIGV